MKEDFNQSSNKYWICNKLFVAGDSKARDHDHVTRKFRGSARLSDSINLRLTKKVLVVSHSLRCYDSHFIMQKNGKFYVKINVIPNRLEDSLSVSFNIFTIF